ncbi:MAG: AraC family transcriptional regulator [Kiritimatiellae bacterium]|nr:AraC family transcriptional regulator [Kiritimatiellia bacterium]
MSVDWSAIRPCVYGVGPSKWAAGQIYGHTWEPPGRSPDNHMLVFIRSGIGRFWLGKRWVPLRAGVCLYLRSNSVYMARQDPDNPVSQYYASILYKDRQGNMIPPPADLPPEFIDPPDPDFIDTTMRRIVNLCYGFSAHGLSRPPRAPRIQALADNLLTGLLMELDLATTRDQGTEKLPALPHHERMVRQAILRIVESPSVMPTVMELAQQSRYSPSRFSAIFRSVTGVSPEGFIVRSRLSRAERLLTGTTKTITEIAEESGYRDIYFFSHQFKKFRGVTPTTYRKHCRTADDQVKLLPF